MAYEDIFRTLRVNNFLEIQSNASFPVQTFTATGTLKAGVATGLITLDHISTPIVLTDLPAPKDSGQLLIISNISASGTEAHTVTCESGVTFDGTNNTATLDAPAEQLILMSISTTRWLILLNSGSVGLSSVA